MPKLVTSFALLSITLTACKDSKSEKPGASASAPVAKPPGTDSRLTLALAMPATLERGYVPNINLEVEKEPRTLEAYKAELAEQEEQPVAAQALADGWAVQLRDRELAYSVVQRTLGKHAYRCESDGQDQTAHDLGRATCLAIVWHGGELLVPFAPPSVDDGASISIDKLSLDVARVDEDSPPTPERFLEDKGWRKTGKLAKAERTAAGFVAIVEGNSGDLATNPRSWDVLVRTKLAGTELTCSAAGSVKSADEATRIADACRTLRAF